MWALIFAEKRRKHLAKRDSQKKRWIGYGNKYKKNGEPSSAIIRPTGSSRGENKVLAKVSHAVTNAPPKIALQGIKILASLPTISRVMCGIINPTNPNIPATLTALAAKIPAIITKISRAVFTFKPKPVATSSPNSKIFN